MKKLLEKAQDATLSAFSGTVQLLNEMPEEEWPERYTAAKALLYAASEMLFREDFKGGCITDIEGCTGWLDRPWKEAVKYVEEQQKND